MQCPLAYSQYVKNVTGYAVLLNSTSHVLYNIQYKYYITFLETSENCEKFKKLNKYFYVYTLRFQMHLVKKYIEAMASCPRGWSSSVPTTSLTLIMVDLSKRKSLENMILLRRPLDAAILRNTWKAILHVDPTPLSEIRQSDSFRSCGLLC